MLALQKPHPGDDQLQSEEEQEEGRITITEAIEALELLLAFEGQQSEPSTSLAGQALTRMSTTLNRRRLRLRGQRVQSTIDQYFPQEIPAIPMKSGLHAAAARDLGLLITPPTEGELEDIALAQLSQQVEVEEAASHLEDERWRAAHLLCNPKPAIPRSLVFSDEVLPTEIPYPLVSE